MVAWSTTPLGRTNRLSAVAVVPQGLEAAGSEELTDLGAHSVKPGRRAVSFEADMACLYRMHLQARLPFRVLRQVASFPCQGRDDLYDGIRRALDWERWLHPSMTCLLYTSPSPRDKRQSRMPSSA